VLDKYGGTLPLLSNQKYNGSLKVIQVMLGIKTVMTSHVARHSFAVMAINKGVPIEIVARMMGHTKIETTQIYAKVLNRSVEDAFDLLEK
jgi:site-specific recombinase XerD